MTIYGCVQLPKTDNAGTHPHLSNTLSNTLCSLTAPKDRQSRDTPCGRCVLLQHLTLGTKICKLGAGSCDAYIKAVVGEQEALTDVKFRDLNPSWGIQVKDKGFTGQVSAVNLQIQPHPLSYTPHTTHTHTHIHTHTQAALILVR
jgi:hypothetical protein